MNRILIFLGLLLCTLASNAQNIQQVTGKVTDKTGPLAGVNILNKKGAGHGTMTDSEGNYSIRAAKGDILQFSFVGMETKEIVVDKTVINVLLSENTLLLDEVVAIGYGTSTKKDLTGAVASIKLEDSPSASLPTVNLLESLKGSLPGVDIGMTSSAGGDPSLNIRGQNSISASNTPLLVVDGIIGGSFSQLNPQDIATIDVLKDASSAAVYGSRAANGVIIVTTKRGKTDKPHLNLNAYYGIQSWTRKPKMMNGEKYNQFRKDQAIASGASGVDLGLEYILLPKEYEAYQAGSEIDWFDEVTQYAPTQNYQLSVSGANDKINYYVSANYLDQKGIIVGDKYNKASFLAKMDVNVFKWAKVGINLSGNTQDYSGMNASSYTATFISPWGFMNSTFAGHEDWLEVFPGGNTSWSNPLRDTHNIDDMDKRNNFDGKAYLEIRLPWIEGLSWRINGSYNLSQKKEGRFYHENYYVQTIKESEILNPSQFLKDANGYKKDTNGNSWLLNQVLNYNHTFGEHRIDLTFMSERQRSHEDGVHATARDFSEAGTTVLGYNSLELGAADKRAIDTWKTQSSSLAYLGRINYVWRNKYHVSASFRRDGFSAFAEGHKYGNFKSAALAWTISEEEFLPNNILSYLKLRLSYGENGNPSIKNYETFPKVGIGAYIFGTEYVKSQYQSSLANKTLGWEKTNAFNVGTDFGLFNDRLTGNIEYYNSNTTNLLVNRRLPSTSGYTSIFDNLGKVANWGLEIGLHSVNIETKDFQWNTSVSFWLNRNKIKSLYGIDSNKDGKEDDDIDNSWFIGKSLGAVYDYTFDGIVQTDDIEYQEKYNMKPGDVKFKDLNEDGKIDAEDKSIIGYTKPNFTVNLKNTLTYKNFQLFFAIDWIAGGGKNNYYIQNNAVAFVPNTTSTSCNWLDKEYWTPETPSNSVPRVNYLQQNYKYGFYQSRAFVRLQDISLSYTFSPRILEKTHVFTDAKVFVSGKNLLTFTGWTGMDPETGQRIGGGNPSFKTVSFGLNVSF